MRAGSTTRFVGIVVGGGSPFTPRTTVQRRRQNCMQHAKNTCASAPLQAWTKSGCRPMPLSAGAGHLTHQPWTAYGGNDDRTCRSCGTHRDGKAFQCSLEDFFADAVPDLDQLHRSRFAVGGDASDCEGVQSGPRDAGTALDLVLLDLCLHA